MGGGSAETAVPIATILSNARRSVCGRDWLRRPGDIMPLLSHMPRYNNILGPETLPLPNGANSIQGRRGFRFFIELQSIPVRGRWIRTHGGTAPKVLGRRGNFHAGVIDCGRSCAVNIPVGSVKWRIAGPICERPEQTSAASASVDGQDHQRITNIWPATPTTAPCCELLQKKMAAWKCVHASYVRKGDKGKCIHC